MVIFKRNDYISVLGDTKEFWICKSLQKFNADNEKQPNFKAVWLESSDGQSYELGSRPHLVPCASILMKIRMTSTGIKNIFKLNPKTKLKLEGMVSSGDEDDGGDDIEELPRKRKLKQRKSGIKVEPKSKKAKKIVVKLPKPKIDKSNPNWKLKPRIGIKIWDKDPLFESHEEVPFVSTASHSHLITRAILTNDMAALKKHLEDRKQIANCNKKRSLCVPLGPMHYCLLMKNMKVSSRASNFPIYFNSREREITGMQFQFPGISGKSILQMKSHKFFNVTFKSILPQNPNIPKLTECF